MRSSLRRRLRAWAEPSHVAAWAEPWAYVPSLGLKSWRRSSTVGHIGSKERKQAFEVAAQLCSRLGLCVQVVCDG